MKIPARAPSIAPILRPRAPHSVARRRTPATASPGRASAPAGQLIKLLPQVRFIARRIHQRLPSHVPVEDLYQAGVLGLLDALRKFDPRRRVRLESYMKFRIRGAILDELRSLDWSPRELRRQARRLEEAHQALCAGLGREPVHEELAAAARISLGRLEELRADLRGLELCSLQEIAMTSDDGVEKDRASQVPCPEALGPHVLYARAEGRARLAEAIELLPENERRVITLYYYEELTMKEVGEVLEVGESRVSQIHSSALQRMRGWVSRSLPEAAAGANDAATVTRDKSLLPPRDEPRTH